jgi:hypothetical protein
MQVLSFEYDVTKMLVSLCIKFHKDPRRKTWLVDVFLGGSVLTGHIRSLARHVQTGPDISGSRAGHIRSFRTTPLLLVSTPHGFFIGLLYLVPSIPIIFSLLFHFFLGW